MMKKNSIIILLFALFTVSVYSQTPEDALRYTSLSYTDGTARSTSMAGAFGALGGDFSSASINPAGIAIYRAPEFSITPSVYYTKSNSNYLGKSSDNTSSVFNIGSFGLVLPFEANREAKQCGFKMFHFALGVNRTNNFERNVLMRGYNENSSITTQWVNEVNNNNPDINNFNESGDPVLNGLNSYSTQLAWDTYLLDWARDDNGKPYIFSDMQGGKVYQTIRYNTSGSMNEFDISGGFNWNDKLYVGATFGIPYFTYNETFKINESDVNNVNPYFSEMSYNTYLKTDGTGFNFKLGLIYKPVQWLRLGLAFHTPTIYNLDDNYQAELTSILNLDSTGNKSYYENSSSYLEYKLKTPMRLIGSVGFIIGNGLISADYEYVDYSKSEFRDNDYQFDDANDMIKTNYTSGSNIRVGTEWGFGIFRIRAGYGYSTSPYSSSEVNSGGERQTISLGAGMKFTKFYMDFGYAYTKEDLDFYPYSRYYVDPSSNTYKYNQFQLTLGFRF